MPYHKRALYLVLILAGRHPLPKPTTWGFTGDFKLLHPVYGIAPGCQPHTAVQLFIVRMPLALATIVLFPQSNAM
ncbi:hypothetical protein Hypma_008259 [Hypsizygus marmoreus]|uniref:Uncharacterized protein n=1 Tax=Hypsizygus marmoreus TaxID=39966 RepID=A0A369JY72_HYPMA|nr:hypothetical protein Hypma_008259 [Hypsizygus marmoreus]